MEGGLEKVVGNRTPEVRRQEGKKERYCVALSPSGKLFWEAAESTIPGTELLHRQLVTQDHLDFLHVW